MDEKENEPPCHEEKENEPPQKRRRLSLFLPKDRFNFCVDDEELSKAMKTYCTKNTAINNKWALKNFEDWFNERKRSVQVEESKQPLEVLLTNDTTELCEMLSLFVKQTRKADGSEYTPKTLYLLLAGLQRQIRLNKGKAAAINIFSDPRLERFHNVCDHEFRRLYQKGIGTEAKHTEALSKDDEKALWDSKVLDLTTPQGLLNCVFFYNGKNLCLRGGDEHRKLKFSQLRRDVLLVDGTEISCYIYNEHGSKNWSGGLGQLHLQNKVIHHFQVPEAGEKDFVKILDLYISKVPEQAIKNDNFYVCPLTKVQEGKPWFCTQPLGKNRLSKMVKTICDAAGIKGNKTNHSLRSYGVSSLFEDIVPEKIIQERSGHRSATALRVYEKTSNQQMIEASRVLTCVESMSLSSSSSSSSEVIAVKQIEKEEKPHVFNGCSFTNCTFSFSEM